MQPGIQQRALARRAQLIRERVPCSKVIPGLTLECILHHFALTANSRIPCPRRKRFEMLRVQALAALTGDGAGACGSGS